MTCIHYTQWTHAGWCLGTQTKQRKEIGRIHKKAQVCAFLAVADKTHPLCMCNWITRRPYLLFTWVHGCAWGEPAGRFCVFSRPSDELYQATDFTPNCNFHITVIPYSSQPLHFISVHELLSVDWSNSRHICFYCVEAQIPAMQQSCKYFCTGVDAHPCFFPRFQLDKQALHWRSLMSQWMPGTWYSSLTGSFKEFLVFLVSDCSGTLWIETLVYNLCL